MRTCRCTSGRAKANAKGERTMNTAAKTRSNDKPQPKTAKELIAANVQSLIEQLDAGHSEALTAYLNAMSRFHNYSFGNILEIARQRAVTYCFTSLGSVNMRVCVLQGTRDGDRRPDVNEANSSKTAGRWG
jgi:hypothetical protein